MPRKKRPDADAADTPNSTGAATPTQGTPAETTATPTADAMVSGESEGEGLADGQGKDWGPAYKAIFTCPAKGFEMGENRRFKQRVFKFKEKPDPEIVAAMKDNGFTYRPEEKVWTIPADNASRLLTDRLAAKFAGESPRLMR